MKRYLAYLLVALLVFGCVPPSCAAVSGMVVQAFCEPGSTVITVSVDLENGDVVQCVTLLVYDSQEEMVYVDALTTDGTDSAVASFDVGQPGEYRCVLRHEDSRWEAVVPVKSDGSWRSFVANINSLSGDAETVALLFAQDCAGYLAADERYQDLKNPQLLWQMLAKEAGTFETMAAVLQAYRDCVDICWLMENPTSRAFRQIYQAREELFGLSAFPQVAKGIFARLQDMVFTRLAVQTYDSPEAFTNAVKEQFLLCVLEHVTDTADVRTIIEVFVEYGILQLDRTVDWYVYQALTGTVFASCAEVEQAIGLLSADVVNPIEYMIEFENIAQENGLMAGAFDNASGGSAAYFLGRGEDGKPTVQEKTVTAVLTAEHDGWYVMTLAAACAGYGNYSPLTVSVNAQDYGMVDGQGTCFLQCDPPEAVSAPYEVKHYTAKSAVYLMKGENQIQLHANARVSDGVVVFSLDYLSFCAVPVKDCLGLDGGTVEWERYATEQAMTVVDAPLASGGKIAAVRSDSVATAMPWKIFAGGFVVQRAGWYDVRIDAACQGRPDTSHLSPVMVSVNGQPPIALDSAVWQWSDPPTQIHNPYRVSYFQYRQPIYLESGENVLLFTATDRNTGSDTDNLVIFGLDCAEFSRTPISSNQCIGASGGILELEQYADDNGMQTVFHPLASGAALAGIVSEEKEQTYQMAWIAETAGWYQMGLDVSGIEKAPAQVSPLTVTINGGQPIPVAQPYFTWQELPHGDIQPYVIAQHTFSEAVYLRKGKNMLEIKATQRAGNDKVVVGLDCVTFFPVGITALSVTGKDPTQMQVMATVNPSEYGAGGVLLIAAYVETGLLDVRLVGSPYTTIMDLHNATKIKAMLWKDLQNMTPVSIPQTLTWNGAAWVSENNFREGVKYDIM